ncbi:hypothetical protein F5148DRAFT_1155835 [Russula earlei]|uniref:Uncharacterized protein n=1 Tax=Russula earlei TaxID=71964 RepID=A0ACC0UPH9_9AGAM|nr:hypothetical protein F5148DRAFT_1155835 [Russula earlei]
MATPSRSSTTSARLRTKTSELSDLFRSRQQSSTPSPSPQAPSKSKRKIPLFSLRKKSPVAPSPRRSPTPPPLPTPRPPTNALSPSVTESTRRHAPPPQLTISSTSFSPLPSFDDASSSKRSSISPTNSKSTRSVTRSSSSHSPNGVNKSRTPTPTSAVTLGGGSFSDSEPPRSNTRTPTALLRSYASDDEERRYLSTRPIPPSKPAPTKSLPPPPDGVSLSAAYPTPTTPSVSFPTPAGTYIPLPSDAKPPSTNIRKLAVSTSATRSPSFKLTSGSESASESAQGYTSASGSESATTGLGLGFRIRTRSGQDSGSDKGSSSRAATVRVGLLRAPNSFAAPRTTSPSPPKSPPVSLTKSSPPAFRTSFERTGPPRPVFPPPSSSAKRASPPIQGAASKSPSDIPGRRQTEPGTAPSGTKHASWLVIPKAVNTSVANSPSQAAGQGIKDTVPTKLRARAASDSRTLTSANAVLPVASNLPAPALTGLSSQQQSITATRPSPAPPATSHSNLLKSPLTIAVPVPTTQSNHVASGTNSPPAEPLPKLPRPSLSRTSSELSHHQATTPPSGSPSSSESSTRTLTIPSNAVSASGSGAVGSSCTDPSQSSGSTTASAVKSGPSVISASGNVRRPSTKDERPAIKDKNNKDSSWPPRSTSKRSSPTVSSPLAQSHTSDSPPYASPSSFSASTTAPPSPQPPPSRVIVPLPPTPANIFALQTENADLRAEIMSLRAQLENADRLARRREREIRGLRWLVINWGGDKKEIDFAATTERRPSGDAAESQEEVQAAVRYLRAESESGYGSGSVSGSHKRMSLSSAYSSVYPAESVSDGSSSEAGISQRIPFGPGPSARASEDQALDAIPERTVVGGEDTQVVEAERRRMKDERRASRALKRLSSSTLSDPPGSGMDEVVSQTMHQSNLAHGRALSIEQVIEGDLARRARVGLKGMDEVLDKLRAVAGVDSGGGVGVKAVQ